jgi:hypothetical protein
MAATTTPSPAAKVGVTTTRRTAALKRRSDASDDAGR